MNYGPLVDLVDQTLQYRFYILSCMFSFLLLLFLSGSYSSMILTTTSQVPMSLKKDNVYAKRGKSQSVDLSLLLINDDTDNEQDSSYVPPCIHTQPPTSRAARGYPWKVFLM